MSTAASLAALVAAIRRGPRIRPLSTLNKLATKAFHPTHVRHQGKREMARRLKNQGPSEGWGRTA